LSFTRKRARTANIMNLLLCLLVIRDIGATSDFHTGLGMRWVCRWKGWSCMLCFVNDLSYYESIILSKQRGFSLSKFLNTHLR
jgi:hypothetical protein